MSTKLYKNTTKLPILVPGIGEIPAGEQVSITTEHQPVVFVENHPGLVDVIAEEEAAKATEKKSE